MNFDLDAIEGYVANHLRLFISMVIGILVFVGIIAVSVFFLYLRGAEQTMVPDVVGYELSSALLELQMKELYPRIQLKHSQTPQEKGLILEQDPQPGTIVKAGRRIRLVVSQGVMINRVENYLGRNIDEVRLDLQTIFASEEGSVPLVAIKEPVSFKFSVETPGTILEQQPQAGSGISGPMVLDFVVSKGQEDALILIPKLISLSIEDALEAVGLSGISFTFNIGSGGAALPLTVIDQSPAADSRVRADTRVSITISPPSSLAPGEVFNIFKHQMAANPYPLSLHLEAQLPSGELRNLLSTEYSGGELTVPYRLPSGTVLVLYVLNREIHRQTVAQAPDMQFEPRANP
ncbi:MAG: PASTA domain-containing protein [Treponema sp.]|jgi:beta-lactam-binding protein with PASTA domain|nr:PASTA domain-containing protein [Treponema sp.]